MKGPDDVYIDQLFDEMDGMTEGQLAEFLAENFSDFDIDNYEE